MESLLSTNKKKKEKQKIGMSKRKGKQDETQREEVKTSVVTRTEVTFTVIL